MTLLNRNELLDALEAERKECRLENERSGFERAYNIVECMGTEPDVELVRHGKWIEWNGMDIPENHGRHKCSECGKFAIKPKYGEEILTDWCPHCGAKMTTA